MRITQLFFLLLLQNSIFAQKNPCEYATNLTDSIGTIKQTKGYLVYEKNFGNTSQYIFLSLLTENDTPKLNLQIIQKSPDFIAPKCVDKNSKVYFQLSNGKIYTFVSESENKCDNLYYNNQEKVNNRLLDSDFLFRKDDFEDLKKFSISLMRIKYASETIDYILPKELNSEKLNEISEPERFFIANFSCIE
ncbi:hypothetical protein [Flavobacterium sp.]|uniref:hypothetical protein n=1 Tax=Flavobacterium sp. TaxID=239 RepID=UPI00286E383A|nr:hypothetical protein [Flavobacterium sp.]